MFTGIFLQKDTSISCHTTCTFTTGIPQTHPLLGLGQFVTFPLCKNRSEANMIVTSGVVPSRKDSSTSNVIAMLFISFNVWIKYTVSFYADENLKPTANDNFFFSKGSLAKTVHTFSC